MEDSERELTFWTRRVLEKLGMLRDLSADFQHTPWIFDWDKKESDAINIERYGKECRALITLSTTGTIGIESAIPLTEITRRYLEINEHGIDLPFSIDAAGAVGRGSGWYRAFFITGFDYQKYHELCKEYELTEADTTSRITLEVRLRGRTVTLWSSVTDYITIKTLRTDSPQFNFMNYILAHPATNISKGDVTAKVGGCSDKKDLTELVRNCGFNAELKVLFFPECSQHRIVFNPSVQIAQPEAEKIARKYIS